MPCASVIRAVWSSSRWTSSSLLSRNRVRPRSVSTSHSDGSTAAETDQDAPDHRHELAARQALLQQLPHLAGRSSRRSIQTNLLARGVAHRQALRGATRAGRPAPARRRRAARAASISTSRPALVVVQAEAAMRWPVVRFTGTPVHHLDLGLVQPGVRPAGVEQFLVPADLDDPAAFHARPAGRPAAACSAGGRWRSSSAPDQVLQRRLDLALRLGVDGRGRLVEDQDARIDQQRPGDRDPLPLAAGERLAALADERVVAVGQPQDELVRARRPGGRDDLVARRVRPAVGDVLGDRAVEQERRPAARCRCCGGTPRRGTSGCRCRRPGSPRRRRRRSGRSG